jgi:hypothetical protein
MSGRNDSHERRRKMPDYQVTVRCTLQQTVHVTAEDEDDAADMAEHALDCDWREIVDGSVEIVKVEQDSTLAERMAAKEETR